MLAHTHKLNDVVTIKLLSGEEIVGYYNGQTDSGISLRKPLVPVPAGQGIGLAPYVLSSDYLTDNTSITFASHAIITIVPTGKQFGQAYTQQVSGLDLSNESGSKLIV